MLLEKQIAYFAVENVCTGLTQHICYEHRFFASKRYTMVWLRGGPSKCYHMWHTILDNQVFHQINVKLMIFFWYVAHAPLITHLRPPWSSSYFSRSMYISFIMDSQLKYFIKILIFHETHLAVIIFRKKRSVCDHYLFMLLLGVGPPYGQVNLC